MTFPEQIDLAWRLLPTELLNTLYMVVGATFFGTLIGFPLGLILALTRPSGLVPRATVYKTLGIIANVGRSIPFAILMIAIIPFTRLVVGTSIGTTASIVPLSLAAAPFLARLVEGALGEVKRGVMEAALVMGATTSQIVRRVLVPEAFPALLSACLVTAVTLVGYSAMAGLVGGGGLGQVAIQYGYQRFNGFLMVLTLVLLLLLVEALQWIGGAFITRIRKKRGLL